MYACALWQRFPRVHRSRCLPAHANVCALVCAQPHVDSFDYFLGDGMQHVVEDMDGIEIEHPLT